MERVAPYVTKIRDPRFSFMGELLSHNGSIDDLVARAKAGDQVAFARLYRDYFTPIHRFLFWRVKNREDADDLSQIVFLKAWKGVPNLKESGNSFLAWLYTIARNAAMDYWRKKKDILYDTPESIEERAGTGDDRTIERLDGQQSAGDLRRVLSHLSQDQQEAVTLKFFGEFSNAEIARMLGKTEVAVRQLQCRGLKAMREYCQEKGIFL